MIWFFFRAYWQDFKIYINNNGILNIDNLQGSMNNVYGGHLSFVDYTNDGKLDVSLSGFQIINFQPFPATVFYKWSDGRYVKDPQADVTYDAYGYDMGYNGGSNNQGNQGPAPSPTSSSMNGNQF